MKRIYSIFLAAVLAAANLPAKAEENYSLKINTDTEIKENTRDMLGVNYEWSKDASFLNSDNTVNEDLTSDFAGYPIGNSRMAGTSSRVVQWKNIVGSVSKRKTYHNGYADILVKYGPSEWLKHMRLMDDGASYTYVFNMETDTLENAMDIVEFFIGDGDINGDGIDWSAKRAEYGLGEEPVNIAMWELGNELDQSAYNNAYVTDEMRAQLAAKTKEEYTETAKKYIKALKEIAPEQKIAICGATGTMNGYDANGNTDDPDITDSTTDLWNEYVIKNLGAEADFITQHVYYRHTEMVKKFNQYEELKRQIKEILGEDAKLKIWFTEHSTYIDTKWTANGQMRRRPHSMHGVLLTSEFFNRIMADPMVYGANYHSLYGGTNWSYIYFDKSNRLKPTGIAMLSKLYEEYAMGKAVQSTLNGYKNTDEWGVTGLTVKDGSGDINIIITNQTSETINVPVTFENGGRYRFVKKSVIYPDMTLDDPLNDADNWYDKTYSYVAERNQIYLSEQYYDKYESCSAVEAAPYSVTAVKVKKTETKNILYNDFESYNTDMKCVTGGVRQERSNYSRVINGRGYTGSDVGVYTGNAAENIPVFNNIDNQNVSIYNLKYGKNICPLSVYNPNLNEMIYSENADGSYTSESPDGNAVYGGLDGYYGFYGHRLFKNYFEDSVDFGVTVQPNYTVQATEKRLNVIKQKEGDEGQFLIFDTSDLVGRKAAAVFGKDYVNFGRESIIKFRVYPFLSGGSFSMSYTKGRLTAGYKPDFTPIDGTDWSIERHTADNYSGEYFDESRKKNVIEFGSNGHIYLFGNDTAASYSKNSKEKQPVTRVSGTNYDIAGQQTAAPDIYYDVSAELICRDGVTEIKVNVTNKNGGIVAEETYTSQTDGFFDDGENGFVFEAVSAPGSGGHNSHRTKFAIDNLSVDRYESGSFNVTHAKKNGSTITVDTEFSEESSYNKAKFIYVVRNGDNEIEGAALKEADRGEILSHTFNVSDAAKKYSVEVYTWKADGSMLALEQKVTETAE